MNVLVVASDPHAGSLLAEALTASGFDSSRETAESACPSHADAIVLDGFNGQEVARLVAVLAGGEPRPVVLAGVPLDRETLDAGIEAGIDGFYISGRPDSLVFQLTAWERRRAGALEDAGNRLEQANDAIYTVDFEGRFTSANAACVTLTGYPREQLVGMSMANLLSPEHVSLARAAIAAKLAGAEESSVFEVRIRRADGVERTVEVSSRLLLERGRPVAIQGIARDVTEQRSAEERLRLLATVVESAAVGVVARDLRGKVVSWNSAAERMFGYTAEEATGVLMAEIVPEDEKDGAAVRFQAVLQGGVFDIETVRLHRDGTPVPVRMTSFPLRDHAGEVTGTATLFYDLAEKRASERALQISEDRYRAAAEMSGDGIYILEAVRGDDGTIEDFRFLDLNSAGEALLTASREQIIGARLTEVVPPNGAGFLARFREVVETGVPIDAEFRVDDPSVRPAWIHQSVVRLGDGVAVTSRDVTRRHEQESELAEARAELRAIFESTSEAIVLIGDDLRLLRTNRAADRIAFRLFGKTPQRGDHIDEWASDADRPHVRRNCQRALAGERVTIPWLMPAFGEGGDRLWIEYTFNPVRDEGGAIYAVAMVARDITAARRLERDLEERESALRAVFESMNDALVLLDPSFQWVLGNPLARARALGTSGREPSPGTPMAEYLQPAQLETLREYHGRALAGERGRIELRTPGAHGVADTWWEYRFMPVRGEAGEVRAVAMVTREITDRKQAELALAEATEHHRTVVDNTPDALFVLEVEGWPEAPLFRVGMVNSAFERLTGLEARMITGRPVQTVLPAFAWEDARDRYYEAIAAGTTISYVEEVPYGERPSVQTRLTPIFDAAGRCTRLVGSTRDITDQVRLAAQERQERERAERLAVIVRSANDAIIGLDMERKIASWSPGAERVYGWTAEEAIGQRVDLIYPGDEAEREAAVIRLESIYAGEEVFDTLTLRRHKSGRLLTMLISAFPLRDSDGNMVGVGSTATDITGQREAEEALRNKAADLDAVFESTRHQIFLLDEHGWIVSANSAAVEGARRVWQQDISAGADMRRFVPDVEVFEANLARCMAGEVLEFERENVVRGLALAMEVDFTPVRREDGSVRGVLLAVRDITERKRTSEALMQAQKLESLAVLAGGIAHDFNNLLVGILGNAGLALNEIPASSPARSTIEAIEVAGLRAAELSRQMLAYSGHGKFVIEAVDMSALVQEMTHLLRVSIGKEIALQLHLAPDLPAVQGDATQLRQVVMNLVVNASDAVGEGAGAISIRTSLVQADAEMLGAMHLSPDLPPGPYVSLEVTDTGAGMDAETRARVFDPFFTTKFTGRGLGLAAALGIMRGHRGAIKVDSTPGEGTTFRLLLPAAGTVPVVGEKSVESAQWVGSGTVLVVDDEPTVRTVTARALRAFGFEVLEAADGAEGVDTFRDARDSIVCVLLDMTMPRMNGEEAYEAITAIDPDAKVILMSGYSEQDAAGRFAGRKLAGFIQKPYELSVLRSSVRAAIEGPAGA